MISIRSTNGDAFDGAEGTTQYVLGGDHVGSAVAEQLRANGHRVAVVDASREPGEVPGGTGDPADVDVLSDSGVGDASTVVVATRSDRRNLLVARLVRARFDVSRIVVFANDPDRLVPFAEAGHEPFCVTTALSEAVGEVV